MMETRDPLEWHFKQLDHAMGLSFRANFNFALVGHLLKGEGKYIGHLDSFMVIWVELCC